MNTRTLELSRTCRFEVAECEEAENYLTLEYIEHSQDHWHSNEETSVPIDKETAAKIIEFLQKAFDKESK